MTDEIAAWQRLYVDPLSELQEVAEVATGGGNPTAAAVLARDLRSVAAPEYLSDFGMDTLWGEAREFVLTNEVARVAISRGASRPDAIRLLLARALVAQLIRKGIELEKVIPDAQVRDSWVTGLRRGMGSDLDSETRAVPFFLKPAVRAISRHLLRPLVESHSPIAGDILYYQARGDGIRDFISRTIAGAHPPVYVMAHSLGGIAAVETLILDPTLKVVVLITFGSQAPFFYEINSLVSLERGRHLPQHFPDVWLNVCDPNDLLSFRAKDVFDMDPRIIDKQLDSGQPPLAAHSAYLGSDSFWSLVWPVLP